MRKDRNYSDNPNLITHRVWLSCAYKPAIHLKDNNYKEWWWMNELHRDSGPAIEHINGDQEWYCFGKRHRPDGPAVVFKDGTYLEYWWLGEKVSEQDYKQIIKKIFNRTLEKF